MRTGVILALLLVCCGASDLRAQQDWRGCYDLQVHPWMPPGEWGADSVFVAPPPRILLDTPAARDQYDRVRGQKLLPAAGVIPSIHAYSWWSVREDSLFLTWSTGFSGIAMQLEATAGRVAGTARAFRDFERPVRTARIEALPIDCEAPLPEDWRFRYRVRRGFATADGDSILIGREVPEEVPLIRTEAGERITADVRLAPPLDPASRLRISVDSAGVVWRMWIDFADGVDYDHLVDNVSASWGAPTSRNAASPVRGGSHSSTVWSDRLTSFSISRSVSAAGDVRISGFIYSRQGF